ncbi:MAG: hypothetical protein E6J64_20415 [Deltaproteobacteria bacterium]|nr:MAG: hypothetical protein E6J64_20415 [Deltaproteobacteria bacterium]
METAPSLRFIARAALIVSAACTTVPPGELPDGLAGRWRLDLGVATNSCRVDLRTEGAFVAIGTFDCGTFSGPATAVRVGWAWSLALGDHGAQPEVLLGFSEPVDGETLLGQSLFGTRQAADALVVLHR